MKKKPDHPSIELVRTRLRDASHLSSAIELLGWDQETNMPPSASEHRAEVLAYLSGVHHAGVVSLNTDGLLTKLQTASQEEVLSPTERALVREVVRDHEQASKLPERFVVEYARVTSRAQHVWQEARRTNDFSLFAPWLGKVIELNRQKAQYLDADANPYDVLLDTYEPGMTSETISIVFEELKDTLVPLVASIKRSKARVPRMPKGPYPMDVQQAFNAEIATKIGFDLSRGRIDESTHPFSAGIHPNDVRVTTRYDVADLWQSFGSILHEVGHGLYEQGLPIAEFGTPLGQAVSLGVHESQSRYWENMIGKSAPFWNFLLPKLKRSFPGVFSNARAGDLYRAVNRVQPSLIRVDADELTYNLHIIIRFEIEKGLIEGTIDVEKLPEIWAQKMHEYLGVRVPDDRRGVLQDVHWSCGYFGYFPTYTIGNLYAAQLHASIRLQVADVDKKIAKGDVADVLSWLRTKVHRHGRRYAPEELMRKATGDPLMVAPFIRYINEKYRALYEL